MESIGVFGYTCICKVIKGSFQLKHMFFFIISRVSQYKF